MSNKLYDILKYVAMVALPALGTAYESLALIWGFPYGEQISASILVIDTALGALLMISSSKYNKKKGGK